MWNLNIRKCKNCGFPSQNLPQPSLKTIPKYRDHQSIEGAYRFHRNILLLSFFEEDNDSVIKILNGSKIGEADQDTDTPIKNLKDNEDVFYYFKIFAMWKTLHQFLKKR